MDNVIAGFRAASNKLVLLDYDGTLTDFASVPEHAILSERASNLLLKLSGKPQTETVIITGRSHQDIDRLVGHLPINIVAEHGAMIKEKGSWSERIKDNGAWKQEILADISHAAKQCPHSFIEEKRFSLCWHYRNVEQSLGYDSSRELIELLKNKTSTHNLRIIDGNKVVEVVSLQTDKGQAAQYLCQKDNYDFVVSIGDDKTDEDMFAALADEEKHFTIKVGQGNTSARYRLAGVGDVIQFLELLL